MRKLKQFLWDRVINILAIIGVSIVVLVFIYPNLLPDDKEFEAGIGGLVLYFGILYNVLIYKIEADKFSKELFNEFNKRFDEINEDLNKIIQSNSFKTKGGLSNEKIIDYLNLCAEEYYWYRKGRIDNLVWESWKKGMIYYLKDATFKEVVEDQRKEKDSYYGLYKELNL